MCAGIPPSQLVAPIRVAAFVLAIGCRQHTQALDPARATAQDVQTSEVRASRSMPSTNFLVARIPPHGVLAGGQAPGTGDTHGGIDLVGGVLISHGPPGRLSLLKSLSGPQHAQPVARRSHDATPMRVEFGMLAAEAMPSARYWLKREEPDTDHLPTCPQTGTTLGVQLIFGFLRIPSVDFC